MPVEVPLRLRFAPDPQRATVAWWFDVSDPTGANGLTTRPDLDWLFEITSWPLQQQRVRVIMVPGPTHNSVCGVLVVLSSSADSQAQSSSRGLGTSRAMNSSLETQPKLSTPSGGCRGVPYGIVGDRLFLPVHSTIAVSTGGVSTGKALPESVVAEMVDKLDEASQYIWHPVRGVIRTENSSVVSLDRLISVPAPQSNDWSHACSKANLNQRLNSVFPDATIDADQVLQQAAEEIGIQSRQLADLPRIPGEIGREAKKLTKALLPAAAALMAIGGAILIALLQPQFFVQMLIGLIACVLILFVLHKVLRASQAVTNRLSSWGRSMMNSVSQLGGRVGSQSSLPDRTPERGSGWLHGLSAWVKTQAKAVTQQLSELRNREVSRLLHMLETQPDEGLRYALPVGSSGGQHRGVGLPGFHLIQRIVDFSLRGTGGGGLIDYWNLDFEYQRRLQVKYRELANREIALGRHRRAAYIFAELLGDLRQAAITLAQGRQYREAAALFEQRLHDTRGAAQCLENGGLFLEAAVRYEKLGEFEKVGEMYERADRLDLAHSAFRQAVDVKLAKLDYVSAAKVLEDRLKSPKEAQETLLAGWPNSPQAASCLSASFQLLARMGKHEQASQQIERLASGEEAFDNVSKLVSCFASLATNYPVSDVQRLAADRTCVLVASELERNRSARSNELLKSVQQLIPSDRLLMADCLRFRQSRNSPSLPLPVRSTEQLERGVVYEMPNGKWDVIAVAQSEVLAIGQPPGRNSQSVLFARWQFSMPRIQLTECKLEGAIDRTFKPMLLASDAWKSTVLYHYLLTPAKPQLQRLPPTDYLLARDVGGCTSFGARTIGACASSTGTLYVVNWDEAPETGSLTVCGLDADCQTLLWSMDVELPSINPLLAIETLDLSAEFPLPLPMAAGRSSCWLAHSRRLIQVTSSGSQQSDELPDRITQLIAPQDTQRDSFVAILPEGGLYWHSNPLRASGIPIASELVESVATFCGRRHLVVADKSQIELYDVTERRPVLKERMEHNDGPPIGLVSIDPHGHVVLVTKSGRVVNYKIRA